jgi:release factor glutamine methyltransferase
MNSAVKKAFFGEYIFQICSNVYEPAEDSYLFAENLHVKLGARVLDMGTGSGILGIIASKFAQEVLAVDLSPHAVQCAKQNALRNGVSGNMSFIQADLFTSFKDSAKFSLILFNAPYLPSEFKEDSSWISNAWVGGLTGRLVIDDFISQAGRHLEKNGEVLLMQSNLAGVNKTLKNFVDIGMKAETVASLSLPFFESLALIKAEYVKK